MTDNEKRLTDALGKLQTVIAETLESMKHKPLLADAQVGWVCEHRNGDHSQIIEIESGITFSIKTDYARKGNMVYSTFTNSGEFGFGLREFDIISVEPLAAVGTAEWAWQMMLLDKKVTLDKRHDSYYDMENGKAIFRSNPSMPISRNRKEFILYAQNCNADNWQIYEPQPQFKVGDWVSFPSPSGTECGKIIEEDDGLYCVKTQYPSGKHILPASQLTLVQPSEVIVNIGCLSGTVKKSAQFIGFFALINDTCIAHISLSALDTPTRELVQSLLEGK